MTGRTRKEQLAREEWHRLLDKVAGILRKLEANGCPDPYFRGHRNAKWKLLPQASRLNIDFNCEDRLFCRFRASGAHLFPPDFSTWDLLFLMRHHGLPTRLLDWTESFSIALYFAIMGAEGDSAVWILDPYALNKSMTGESSVVHLNTLYKQGYEQYFLMKDSRHHERLPSVLAVEGSSRVARMQFQHSVFTLHKNLKFLIDEKYPKAVTKIRIPHRILAYAKDFLELSGVNESTVFPDLDGLSRQLRIWELDEQMLPGGWNYSRASK